MKPPIFDNIRWGELLGWLTAVVGLLQWLQSMPIPEAYKHYIGLALTTLVYILAYLRNPKTLAWINSGFRGIPPAPPSYTQDRSDEI